MSRKTTQWGVIAVLVGMMAGTGALAAPVPVPGPAPKEARTPPTETFTLKRGEVKSLELPGVTRVSVGDPSVVDIDVAGNNVFKVTGVSEGEATVIVWTKDGQSRTYAIHVGK